MEMNCNIVRDLLPLYHDGVCSQDTRTAVEEHLTGCAACREELFAMDEKLNISTVGLEEKKALGTLSKAWKKAKKRSFFKGFIITVLVIALMVGAYAGCFFTVRMPGVSMTPTINDGDICIFTRFGEPEVGDIVAMRLTMFTNSTKITDVSRIVAGPGDTVTIRNGALYVNGELSTPLPADTYLTAYWGDGDFTVPQGEYFIAGDNQENSLDSLDEIYGTVRYECITGRYLFSIHLGLFGHIGAVAAEPVQVQELGPSEE